MENQKTIKEIIAELGPRPGVAVAAHKLLTERGHKCHINNVYAVIERNGAGSEDVALAVFDAISGIKAKRAQLAERRAAVAA